MPVSRSLSITVTFNCTHDASNNTYGGTATYQQTASTPDLGQVVDSDGTIHLDRAPAPPSGYTENVDIYFTLATPASVTPDGTTTPVSWSTVYGPGMTITVPPGGNGNEFTVTTYPDQPNLILVEDNDDDSNTYSYKPFVQLTAIGNYRIGLDPQIVNRPP